MKKLLIASTLLVSTALAGCATTAPNGTTTAVDINSIISATQQAAITACGFEPTVATVGAIIANAAAPGSAAITAIATSTANAICAAVTAKSVKLGTSVATLNGVPIEGTFVAKGLKKGATINGVLIDGKFVR